MSTTEARAVAGGRRGKNADSASAFIPTGIHQKQSQRWQRVASVPEPDFEAYIAESRFSPPDTWFSTRGTAAGGGQR
jgi:hypothetical protein